MTEDKTETRLGLALIGTLVLILLLIGGSVVVRALPNTRSAGGDWEPVRIYCPNGPRPVMCFDAVSNGFDPNQSAEEREHLAQLVCGVLANDGGDIAKTIADVQLMPKALGPYTAQQYVVGAINTFCPRWQKQLTAFVAGT